MFKNMANAFCTASKVRKVLALWDSQLPVCVLDFRVFGIYFASDQGQLDIVGEMHVNYLYKWRP